jgi:hypothetical protein
MKVLAVATVINKQVKIKKAESLSRDSFQQIEKILRRKEVA